MDLTEKKLESELIFDGRVLTVRKDKVLLPNGNTSTREVAYHKGAVAVVPLTKDGEVILVSQYRYAFEKEILEIPAGKLDYTGEVPLDACIRELKEETGYTAGKIIPLGSYLASPGCLSERVYLFLAMDLVEGETCPDEDEFLNIIKMPLDEFTNMIMSGEIEDGKTIAGGLKTHFYLKHQ